MSSDGQRCPVVLPDLGVPDVEIGVWHADVGDHVYQGDRIVEVLLNGATFDVTSPVTGELVERTLMLRDRATVGTQLGVVIADVE